MRRAVDPQDENLRKLLEASVLAAETWQAMPREIKQAMTSEETWPLMLDLTRLACAHIRLQRAAEESGRWAWLPWRRSVPVPPRLGDVLEQTIREEPKP